MIFPLRVPLTSMDLHSPQSGVPCSSTHFTGGPAAELDKSCLSGRMFTGLASDGPGYPDCSSTKGTVQDHSQP